MDTQWIYRISILVLSTAGLGLASADARAQGYPSKPITYVVPSGPGGGNDVIARIIAKKVSENWSQPLVAENRSGATGTIAMDFTAKALPDGYTIVIASTSHIINQFVSKVRYDVLRDFAPVALTGSLPYVLAVTNALPVKSMNELVALAKSRPGKIHYAGQTGGVSHLMGEAFKSARGIDVVFVPYKTTIDAQADVLSGRVEIWFTTLASALPQVKVGKVSVLGVSGERRAAALPDVPTMAEIGLPALDTSVGFFTLAPAGTPKPIISALNSQLLKAMGTKEVRDLLAAAGVEPKSSSPEELGAIIKSESARWGKFIKESAIRAQ